MLLRLFAEKPFICLSFRLSYFLLKKCGSWKNRTNWLISARLIHCPGRWIGLCSKPLKKNSIGRPAQMKTLEINQPIDGGRTFHVEKVDLFLELSFYFLISTCDWKRQWASFIFRWVFFSPLLLKLIFFFLLFLARFVYSIMRDFPFYPPAGKWLLVWNCSSSRRRKSRERATSWSTTRRAKEKE